MDLYHNTQDDTRMTGRMFSILLYELRNNKSRAELKFCLGRKHAVFLFKAVKQTVVNARMPSGESLRASAAAFTASKSSLDSVGNDKIDIHLSGKPGWLQQGVLDKNMLNLAQKHHELLKADLPKDPTKPEKRKLLFIGKKIVTIVHDSLRISRERSRAKMFECGLFPFVDWHEYASCQNDNHLPAIRFLRTDICAVGPSQVPDTSVGSVTEAYTGNAKLIVTLISERKELAVEVVYMVTVAAKMETNR